MSRTYIEATYIDPNVCFECGAPATERHHIVPASLGGTKTIPLCGVCHAKVHDISGKRRNQLAELTKKSLEKRKELIEKEGGFYSRHGKWVTKLGGNADMTAANLASAKARTAARENWMKESEVGKYIQAKWMEGWTFTDILHDLERLYEISPDVYCSRTGGCVSKGTLSKMLSFYSEWKNDYITQTTLQTSKEKWLQRSEACQFVRELYSSFKTRYLITSKKIKLFNEYYTLYNGNKIRSNGQWLVLTKELGFGDIPTTTIDIIEYLYHWAQIYIKQSTGCEILKRESFYIITPLDVLVNPIKIHKWTSFLKGLQADGVIEATLNENNQFVYNFTSKEIAQKIVSDMEI